MPRSKKKDVRKMTDDELLHDLFPAKVVRHLKKVAHDARKKAPLKHHRPK